MKIWKRSEMKDVSGDLMLLYGPAGVGKSVTTIQTAKAPIMYIMVEPRSVEKFVVASGREDVDIDFAFYEGFEELMEFVNDTSNFERYNTIVVDSISHLIAISLSDEILEEGFDKLDAKSKKAMDKPLTMRAKMSMEGYGTLGGSMLRFTNSISKLSQLGKVVVCLARIEENPKYNKQLSAAPALKGQEYSKHMQGFFDFIGLVESRTDENGEVVYPPAVSFEGDGSFMCKFTGKRPEGGVQNKPLHICKILQVANGGNGDTKKNGKEEKS